MKTEINIKSLAKLFDHEISLEIPGWDIMDQKNREAARDAIANEDLATMQDRLHDRAVDIVARHLGISDEDLNKPRKRLSRGLFDQEGKEKTPGDQEKDDEFEEILFGDEESRKRDTRTENIGAEGLNAVNHLMLMFNGSGENLFWFNEFIDRRERVSFDTIADYDRKNHNFQEECIAEEIPGYTKKPWTGRLFHDWARLVSDGEMAYVNMSMLAAHIHTILEEAGSDHIQKIVPSSLVDGPNHGNRDEHGIEIDLVTIADGAEDIEHALNTMHHRWINETYNSLLERFEKESSCKAWIIKDDNPADIDNNINIVFSDTTALQATRIRFIMRDIEAIAGDIQDIKIIAEKESADHVSRINLLHSALIAGDWSSIDDELRERAAKSKIRAKEAMDRGAQKTPFWNLI